MKDLNLQRGKYVSAHYRISDKDLNTMNKDREVTEELVTTNNLNYDIEKSIACKKIISKTIPIILICIDILYESFLKSLVR